MRASMNRSAQARIFAEECRKARRRGNPFCLALIDADNFKAINDNHGHDAGDMVLVIQMQGADINSANAALARGDYAAASAEYLRLAGMLLKGTEPLAPAAMADRDIFELLGFD